MPPLLLDNYDLSKVGLSVIFIIAALSMNIAIGFAGEFLLTAPLALGVAAYATGIAAAHYHQNSLVAMAIGVVVGTAASILLALPGLKVRGFYLAVIGIFAVYAFPSAVNVMEHWTGGEDGLTGFEVPSIGGHDFGSLEWYVIGYVALVLTLLVTARVSGSAWGLRIRALRDARYAGLSVGYSTTATKITVYALSSVPAAVAGAIYTYQQQFLSARTFSINLTLLLLAGVLLGSKGTTIGPLIGMIPLVIFRFYVGEFSLWSPIIYGAVLVGVAIAFPDGLLRAARSIQRRYRRTAGHVVKPAAVVDSGGDDSPGSHSEALVRTRLEVVGELPALEVKSVTKQFLGTVALGDVSLAILPNTVFGLVGPNGSGKSTLLNVVAGVYRVDAGQVLLAGANITNWPSYRVASSGIGRTFQVPQLIDECTVLQNIELGLIRRSGHSLAMELIGTRACRSSETARVGEARQILGRLGLDPELGDRAVSELPLGLKRIVEIGRALALHPRLLLLDEPTAGLNPEERHDVGKLIVQLKERQVTVLVVEHNVPFVLEFCDEVALLEEGSVVSVGSTRQRLAPRLAAYLSHGAVS